MQIALSNNYLVGHEKIWPDDPEKIYEDAKKGFAQKILQFAIKFADKTVAKPTKISPEILKIQLTPESWSDFGKYIAQFEKFGQTSIILARNRKKLVEPREFSPATKLGPDSEKFLLDSNKSRQTHVRLVAIPGKHVQIPKNLPGP